MRMIPSYCMLFWCVDVFFLQVHVDAGFPQSEHIRPDSVEYTKRDLSAIQPLPQFPAALEGHYGMSENSINIIENAIINKQPRRSERGLGN